MMRSRVKENTMLFVLIFSLTAGFCSAKDNKPPDTKVTIYIYIYISYNIATTHFFYYS